MFYFLKLAVKYIVMVMNEVYNFASVIYIVMVMNEVYNFASVIFRHCEESKH